MHDKLVIRGSFAPEIMVEWIAHRAGRLSINFATEVMCPDRIEVDVSGPEELIDAMALACSLGPASTLIHEVRRTNETEILLQ